MNSLCSMPWESKENYQHGLHAGPLEFQLLWSKGCLTNPFRTPLLCFGVTGKTPDLISCNNFVKKNFVCIGQCDKCLGKIWLDLTFAWVSRIVETKCAHNFVFTKSSFRIWRTTVFGMFKDSAFILDVIWRSFGANQQQQQCLPQLESILDSHLACHLLRAPFHLKIKNAIWKHLISSEPYSHKPFASILVFLLQIDRLWNKILWQLCVHLCHPWCMKKTDFTRQVITRTLLKNNKRNSVCKWMLVDST